MKKDSVITIFKHGEDGAKDSKSVVRPSRRTPYRARRISGGIRFFDLGWKKIGDTFATIPFVSPVAANPLRPNTPSPSNDSQLFDDTQLTAAHFTARDALIFDVPVEDLAKNFKQIKEAHSKIHQINVQWGDTFYTLSEKSAEWTGGFFKPKGELNLPENGDLTGKFGVFWHGWLTSSFTSSLLKITKERNFAAAAVKFIPTKRMDIFFMPGFLLEVAGAQERFTQSPTLNRLEYLNNLNIIGSRELDFDESHPNYGQFQAAHNLEWYSDGGSNTNYTTAHIAARYHQQKYPYRAITILFDTLKYPQGKGYSFEDLAVADFARVFSSPNNPPSGSHSYFLTSGAYPVVVETAGVLVLVIQQGKETYYFWTR